MSTIKIDNKEYKLEELSDNSRAQIGSIQIADQKISSLQSDLALTQTARNAYANALASQLPELAHPNKKKDIITIDNKNYAVEDFSDAAKEQLKNIQVTDNKLAQLQTELAITQTARNTYSQALTEALAK